MLYATTRTKSNVETAYKAIHLDTAGDGGLFVPFRMTAWDKEEIRALKDRSFGQNMAQVLNFFFSTGLTGWDIEFAAGRSPVRVDTVSRRIYVSEAWHNSHWKLEHLVQLVSDRLRGSEGEEMPTNWVRLAVHIAAIFASYGNLLATGQLEPDQVLDMAVTTGDFTAPMAAWYARQLGLPIGNILCGCNANGGLWDLVNHGQMATGNISVKTVTPEADCVLPRNLERLIYETLGMEEVQRYLACCHLGDTYELEEEPLQKLKEGLFVAVISDSRVESVTYSVYRSAGYVFSPYTALAYAALTDYRARTGETRPVLLLAERSPTCDVETVARFLRVDTTTVFRRMSEK